MISSNLLRQPDYLALKWQLKLSPKDSALLIVRSIRSRKTPTTSPTCHCLPNVSAEPEYTFSSLKETSILYILNFLSNILIQLSTSYFY